MARFELTQDDLSQSNVQDGRFVFTNEELDSSLIPQKVETATPAAEPPKEMDWGDAAVMAAKGTADVAGTILNMPWQFIMSAGVGVGAVVDLAKKKVEEVMGDNPDYGEVGDRINKALERISYTPKTEYGETVEDAIGTVFEAIIDAPANWLGDKTRDRALELGMTEEQATERGAANAQNYAIAINTLLAGLPGGVKQIRAKIAERKAQTRAQAGLPPEQAKSPPPAETEVDSVRPGKQAPTFEAEKNAVKSETSLEEGSPLLETEASIRAEASANKPPESPTVGLATRSAAKDIEGAFIPDKQVEAFFNETKGVKKQSLKERSKEFLDSLGNKLTRTYEHLPNTGEYIGLKTVLKRLEHSKGVVADRVPRDLDAITYDLTPNRMELFRRKVVLDDLAFTAASKRGLPRNFTPDQINKAKAHIDGEVVKDPKIKNAIDKRKMLWGSLREEVIKAYQDIGIDVENRFSNPDYFRHMILDNMDSRRVIQGTGKELTTPRGRSYLKKRTGSEKDFNTDYLQGEFEVMAGLMHDIDIARAIKHVKDNHDIYPALREQFGKEWTKNIPEGYREFQADVNNAMYLADTLPAKLAESLHSGALEELGVSASDLRKALVMGGKKAPMVLKDNVASTLENLTKSRDENMFAKAGKDITRAWKTWQLISPRRFFKYNLRNLVGDAEAMFVGNPSAFKNVPKAASELYDTMVLQKPPSPELQSWIEKGGMQSTLQVAELGDINKLALFKRYQEAKGTVKEIPEKTWQGYWKAVRMSTDFRENLLRYSAYLDYLKQLKDGKGKPNNYGASIREEIDFLKSDTDKAYRLSKELLGAYDELTVVGQSLREHAIPFWSYQEVNFKRYMRLVNNAVEDGKLAEQVGRKLLTTAAITTPRVAYKVGKFAVKAAALWAGLEAYNHSRYPDLVDEVPEHVKTRPHLILGRGADGEVEYFSNLGNLGDFVEWFGLDVAPELVRDWYAGKKTISQVAVEIAKSPANKVAQSAFPLYKMAAETALGSSIYPNVFEPKTVKDRTMYLARSFGMEHEVASVLNKPSRPYNESLPYFFYYKAQGGEAGYSEVMDKKKEFLRKMNKGHEGSIVTPASSALYNLRLGIKYEDKEAIQKYMNEYALAGGTAKGITRSLKNMHPLAGLPKGTEEAFLSEFKTDEDKKALRGAMQFYTETLLGTKPEASSSSYGR